MKAFPIEQFSDVEHYVTVSRGALVSGADGLDLVRELIADLPLRLANGGAAILEIDPQQSDEVLALAQNALPGARVSSMKDLSGRDRFIIVDRK